MKWDIRLVAVTVACASVVSAYFGHQRGVEQAPEIAEARRLSDVEMAKFLSNQADAGLPLDRSGFCDVMIEGAADVLWGERIEDEGTENAAAHDASR